MAVSKIALGLNARNYLFIKPLNFRLAKKRADDKLITKRRLIKHKIPNPNLIAVFRSLAEVRSFAWTDLPKEFVLKPARGYGGAGITVIRSWNGGEGKRPDGSAITVAGLEAEIFSILDGAYSMGDLADVAFLEEKITVSRTLRKFSKKGVPDVRVIVCNKVPIMAMLRLPTAYSDGKANLHQGAIGIGIDLRTGITTNGVFFGDIVTHFPGTKDKTRGIKIPHWGAVLRIATETQEAVKLGYAGVDVVIDDILGPLVLEVNARPGLQIQLANSASLRTRLERVAGMTIPSVAFGVDLAKKLFAEHTLVDVTDEKNVLGIFERVTMYGKTGKKVVRAKIDTGAYRTSIDVALLEELGLSSHDRVVKVKNSSGRHERGTVEVRFRLRGKDIATLASYNDRHHMRFPVIIGRRDLEGFLVDPSRVERDV